MKYSRTDNGEETVLKIEGTLDAVTAPELRSVVDELVSASRKEVTLDLSALRLIDSSGVAALVKLYKGIRGSGGAIAISGARDQPLAIFKLLRMDKVFNL